MKKSIQSTVFPLDYDRNNKSDKSFEQWQRYIRTEVLIESYPSVFNQPVVQANKILLNK